MFVFFLLQTQSRKIPRSKLNREFYSSYRRNEFDYFPDFNPMFQLLNTKEEYKNYCQDENKNRTICTIGNETEEERHPLRVHFDFSPNNSSYHYFCDHVGKTVYINGNKDMYNCTANDIINEEQMENLKLTFENLSNYISKLIRVKPEPPHQKRVIGFNDNPYDVNETISDIDYYCYVRVRPPYTRMQYALSLEDRFNLKTGRPYIGVIDVYTRILPHLDSPQNINDDTNVAFMVLLHELLHGLGIDKDQSERWIDRSTGNQYNYSVIEEYRLADYENKPFYQFISPKCKEIAQKLLHKTTINTTKGIIPLGLEIQDRGGVGTEVHHVKQVIYAQEVMAAYPTSQSVVSAITLSLIDDSGWYTGNWDLVEHMSWGSFELLNSSDYDFTAKYGIKPYYANLPEIYLYEATERLDNGSIVLNSGLDNFYSPDKKGLCRVIYNFYDLNEDKDDLKNYSNLYIPDNQDEQHLSSIEGYDYTLTICDDVTDYCKKGFIFYVVNDDETEKTLCMDIIKIDDSSYTFSISTHTETFTCNETTETLSISFDGYDYEFDCGNVSEYKKIIDFYNSPKIKLERIPLYGDTLKNEDDNDLILIIIVVCVVLVVIIIVIVIIILVIKHKRRKEDVSVINEPDTVQHTNLLI